MKYRYYYCLSCSLFFLICLAGPCVAQRQMEYLNRGIIAMNEGGGKVYLGWRLFATDPDEMGFNLYRKEADSKKLLRLNSRPILTSTNFVDSNVHTEKENVYYVRPVLKGKELPGESYTLKANTPVQQFLNVPLKTPEGYTPNDVSVADLDGDGQYELIVHMTGRGRDNSQNGMTDPPIFDAYMSYSIR